MELGRLLNIAKNKKKYIQKPSKQDLDLYYDPEMAKILDQEPAVSDNIIPYSWGG